MNKFFEKLGWVLPFKENLKIFCDIMSVFSLAKDSKSHQNTNHILKKFNYIWNKVNWGDNCIHGIHIDQNIVGPIHKDLP